MSCFTVSLFGVSLALAGAAGSAVAQPAGASAVITGVSGLYIDLSIQTRRDLCSARFKDTQPAWRERTAAWQSRNDTTLAELRDLAARHEGRQGSAAGNPATAAAAATVVQQFKLMAALAPATNLAPLVDEQAAWVCQQWLSDLEPAGKVDATLPRLLDAARKLHSTSR
jgi:hypothetical protein